MKINVQNATRIVLKMGQSGWSAVYAKNDFLRHVFVFRIFVQFFFLFFFVGRKMQTFFANLLYLI